MFIVYYLGKISNNIMEIGLIILYGLIVLSILYTIYDNSKSGKPTSVRMLLFITLLLIISMFYFILTINKK
jgi:hypothetical protein